MSDDELKLIVSATLKSLLTLGKISTPITSLQLLTRTISSKLPPGLLPGPSAPPRFKLTDLARFEAILEDLSWSWESGTIVLSRDGGSLNIIDLHLSTPGNAAACDSVSSRKRKRVVDEDADSAAGEEDTDEQELLIKRIPAMPLGAFSKELKEVYAILQKGTAKGRLLAEQVCPISITI
jgi:mRNA (2'-O-methyladenosine-N6-)-methyltransferase